MNKKKVGAAHIHTLYSFDSLSRIEKIVEEAKRLNLSFLLIADHDSWEGSIKAREYAQQKGYEIEIPIAAEFYTDIGDLIIAGIKTPFPKIFDHKKLCEEAKKQGGWSILVHPYDRHNLEKTDRALIDIVEIYNARTTQEKNARAQQLAKDWNKPIIYGADAHSVSHIKHALFSYTPGPLFPLEVEPLSLEQTSIFQKHKSQMVKAYKTKDIKLALLIASRMIRSLFNL